MSSSRMRAALAAVCALAGVLAAGPVAGQRPPAGGDVGARGADLSAEIPVGALKGLTWRGIGPNAGGRSLAVAGSAARPNEYYMGATGGGLWRTEDGGQTWKPVTDGKIGSSSVGAVAVCEANPDVVYLGMGETELRGNIMQGDGVYRSRDGGKTWQHVGLENTQAIGRILIAPGGCDDVYVAAFGHPYGRSADRGVYRSTDGGGHWRKVLYRDDRTGAIDLAMDPSGKTIYAALWDAYRTPWQLSSGGPGSGIFESTDAGEHWREITRNPGLPRGIIGKVGLSVSPADPRRVYAIVEAQDGGVFRSDDGGATWTRQNDERKLRQRAFYYTRIYADPKDRDVVYVVNVQFWRSKDGGKTFPKPIRTPHGDNHALWIAPNDARRMAEANDGGATVSVNGGASWTAETMPTAQLYHVIADSHEPYFACGAQQDRSTVCMPSKGWGFVVGSAGGGPGSYFYPVGGGESGYIANSPADPDVYFAGNYGGYLTAFDHANGQLRAVNPWPDNPMGYSSGEIAERFQWTFPIVVDPLDPKVLYAGSQHVWRTTNEGQSWARISPDLTRHDPKTMGPSGGPITHDESGVETYATVFSIAPSPVRAGVIWTGSDDGLVQLTQDGGRTWKNVTPPALLPFARIALVEASPRQAGTAYVAANRYQLDDLGVYLYRTGDFGRTWTRITNGIRPNDFVRAVRADPVRPGLLYAGTEHGIYVSFDDGGLWQPLSLNLPDVQVPDITIRDGDVVIATHGRGAYVLDGGADLLRQLTPEVARAPAHLFRPAPATRSVDRAATIVYRLERPARTLAIELLDARGTVIRRFETEAGRRDTTRREGSEEEEFFGPRQATHPPDSAGLNRFGWDMRYAGPVTFPKLVLWAARPVGPRAVPGDYQVRLIADGAAQTQPLVIRADPRLHDVTPADLQAEFDLASRIRDRFSEANAAVVQIRDVRAALEQREKSTPDPTVHTLADALTRRLGGIEDQLYQTRLVANEDALNFPIELNNKLGALQAVVESADAAPTAQDYLVFNDLTAQLELHLADLRRTMATGLPSLNAALAARKLAVVDVPPLKVVSVTATDAGTGSNLDADAEADR